MKKILLILLALVLCLGVMVACDENETSADTSSSEASSSSSAPDSSSDKPIDPVNPALKNAAEYLKTMYEDKPEITGSDYVMTGVLSISGKKYTVTWTVDVAEGVSIVVSEDGTTVTIDVNEKTSVDIPYVLTATIQGEGGETTVKFNRKVPMFKENTYAEFVAMDAKAPVVVRGVVTGIISKTNGNSSNGLYLQGTDGGFYVYNMSVDPVADLKLETGMTVRVTGVKDTYNGTLEVIEASVEVLDTNKTAVTPTDYTEKFTKAAKLTDESLVGVQAALVTIKGVEITSFDASTGYYRFKLGELESYVRISSSACPMVKADQTKMIEAHKAHFGYKADVTGVVSVYSGAFYLTPVSADAFTNFQMPERNDEQKVELEKSTLDFNKDITSATTLILPLVGGTYSDVKITWVSDNACAKVESDKLVITMPEATTSVKLTATLKCGDKTDTAEFTLKLIVSNSFVSQALAAAALLEDKAYSEKEWIVVGTVSKFDKGGEYSEQYGNASFYLSDGTQEILVFRTKMEGVANVKVGDTLALKGKLQNYGGKLELTGATVYANLTTAADAVTAGLAGTGAEGTVLYGQISAITTAYSEQYGNITVTLKDASGEISCYRLKGGADLAVGDFIVVTGTPSAYSGKAQMAAGATYVKNPEITEAPVDPEKPDTPDTPVIPEGSKSVSELLEIVGGLEAGAVTDTTYTVTGVVKSIGEYTTYYKNVVITDGTKEFLIYTADLGEGVSRFGVGATITATGYVKNYNGTIEMAGANKVNVVIIAAAGGEPVNPDTPDTPDTPVTPEGNKATITFGNETEFKSNRTEYDTSKQVWKENGITFTNTKGASTNNVGDFGYPVRCYKSSDIKLEFDGDIVTIVFHVSTYKDNDYATPLANTINASGAATAVVEGKTVTVTLKVAAGELVITGLEAQVRIDSIDVYTK